MARTLNAGKAVIELSLLSGPIDKQLKSLEARLQKFGKTLSNVGKAGLKVGAAITAPFVAASKVFIDTGDQLEKMALRTGFSVESLSELKYAAGQSGTSIEAVEKAARGMARMLVNAGRGSSTAVDNLSDLGLTLNQLKGLKPEDQFTLIAGRIAAIDDPTTRAAIAMKAFGKSGVELLPMLANGTAGVEALRQRARELGLVMSTEDAQAAAKLGDALDDLWTQVTAMAQQIGAAVAGPLTDFLKSTQDNFKGVIDWVKANRELMALIATLGAVVTAASVTVFIFGHVVTSAATAIKALRLAITFLSAHPLVALITLIAGIVILILHWTGALDKLLGRLGKLLGMSDETNDSVGELNKTLNDLSNIKPPDLSDLDIPDVTDLADMPPIAADVEFDEEHLRNREDALQPGAVRTALAKGKALEGLEVVRRTEAVFDANLARQTLGDSSVQEEQLRELKGIRKGIERPRRNGVPTAP